MGLGYDQDRWDDHQMLASARVTGAAAANYNSTGTWTMDYIWTPVTVGAAVSTKQTVTGAILLALALSAGTGALLFGFDMPFQKVRPGTLNENTEP